MKEELEGWHIRKEDQCWLRPQCRGPCEWGVPATALVKMTDTNCIESSQWQWSSETSPNFQYLPTWFFSNPITDKSYIEPEEKEKILAASIFLKWIQLSDIIFCSWFSFKHIQCVKNILFLLTFFVRKLKANTFLSKSDKQILKVLRFLSNATWRNRLVYKLKDVL